MKANGGKLVFLLILFSAFILRLWGINFGLPFQFHQDEPIVVNHALAYGTGDLNPHFFAIPPLTSYILFFFYGLYFLIGKLAGIFQTPYDFALSFFKDPTIFYILGRLFIGVIPGTLCVLIIYKLYRLVFPSVKGALFSAALLAFSFLNVIDSHYIYTDMLMLLFILLSVLYLEKIMDYPSLKNYLFAGTFIGLATVTKYNAILLLAPFLITHLVVFRKKKARLISLNLILGITAIIAVFFIVIPFAVLDFKSFMHSVSGQAGASGYVGWMHHFTYSLRESIGVFFLVLGLIGFVLLFLKEREKCLFLLSFPVIFYLHLVFLSQPFPRYAIPLIPFFAMAGGYLIFEHVFIKIRKRELKIALILSCLFLFIPLTVKAIKADMLFSSSDTRIESADWIKANLGAGAKIALDHTFFRPPILQNKEQILDKYKAIDLQKDLSALKNIKLKLMLEAQKEETAYYLYFLSINPQGQGQFLTTLPAVSFDLNELKNKNIDYVVINYTNRQKNTTDFYKNLKKEGMLLTSFSPYGDGAIRMSYDTTATTSMPVSSKEIYSRIKSGPALEIYSIKK